MVSRFIKFFKKLFRIFETRNHFKLGFYGPPNSGKTTLANRISKDWLGKPIGAVSKIPHETRQVVFSEEEIEIENDGKKLKFKLVDTPGITTKIDYENFLKYGLKGKEARKRAKEATKGVIESIKWLDDMDLVVIVLDSTQNPYTQVNITIIGNLVARDIPVLIVANKIDLKSSNLKRVEGAFPEYGVAGISAKKGKNMEKFYDDLFRLSKGKKIKKKRKKEIKEFVKEVEPLKEKLKNKKRSKTKKRKTKKSE